MPQGGCNTKATQNQYRDTAQSEPSGASASSGTRLPLLHNEAIFDVAALWDARSAVSPSQFATCGDDNRVVITDWLSNTVIASWQAHERCVNRVGSGNTCDRLVTCSRDMSVKVWNRLNTKEPLATMTGHTLTVAAAEFSPGTHLPVAWPRRFVVVAAVTQTFFTAGGCPWGG